MDRDRTSETEETIVERVEGVEAPPPPPGTPPEREEAVVRESETVRSRPDGAIERDTVRHEDRRRTPTSRLGLWLALLLLLVLGGLGAAWYFTQEDTQEVPSVEGLPLDQAVSRLQEDGFRTDIVT